MSADGTPTILTNALKSDVLLTGKEEKAVKAYYNIYVIGTNDTVLERAKGISAVRLPQLIAHLEEKYRDQLQAGNAYIGIEVGF